MILTNIQLSATEKFTAHYDKYDNTFSIYYYVGDKRGMYGTQDIPRKYLNEYIKLVSQL